MSVTKIYPLLSSERVNFFGAGVTKEQVISELCELSSGKVTDVEGFSRSIMEREALVSTGIGLEFAIPHVKNNFVPNFFITLGIIRDGVEWDSIDRKPVKIVFLIGGPEGKQNEYLSVLSKISLIIKNPLSKQHILDAESPEAILEFFARF